VSTSVGTSTYGTVYTHKGTDYFWGAGGAFYTLHAVVSRYSVGFFLMSPMGASLGEHGDINKLLEAGGYALYPPVSVERPSAAHFQLPLIRLELPLKTSSGNSGKK
jgi:hypothetical protein